MGWPTLIPFLSVALLIIAYLSFGWEVAGLSAAWSKQWLEEGLPLQVGLEEGTFIWTVHLLALLGIVLTSLALTAPVTLLTFFVGSWLKSEIKSMFSILLWSFLFVLMLRWFNFFVELLVLLASAMLGRVQLRSMGLNSSWTWFVVTVICLLSFSGGAYGYFRWYRYI
ncbi:MAG: hypothetical protein ACKN9E_15285 [Microcystaceae cyanobacterium]|nr:hypothetical protein [Merismopediaceae bacterium]